VHPVKGPRPDQVVDKSLKETTMTEKTQRGLCCHEAGHAVVAWSFGVRVVAVYVTFSVARGWHGGTDYMDGSALHYMDQVTNFAAGRTGEEVFSCPAHYGAWLADLGEISVVLNNNGIPEDKHWARVTEARERARLILENHRERSLKLVDRLAEAGYVGDAEFLRLMHGLA
jgi:ATP-dependent Zn protease